MSTRMTTACCLAGCVAVNVCTALFTGRWEAAWERSWFQGVLAICVWFNSRQERTKQDQSPLRFSGTMDELLALLAEYERRAEAAKR